VPDAVLAQLLEDLDPWLRVWALQWALTRPESKALPRRAVDAALDAALADADPRIFLLAAAERGRAAGSEARERVLALAVGGPRAHRARAWRALEAWLPTAGGDASDDAGGTPAMAPWEPPAASASVDERVRAAAAFRARMGH
jgi:hypothetical protein